MEPFRQKGSSMASWSTFICKSVVQAHHNGNPKQQKLFYIPKYLQFLILVKSYLNNN